jgi:tetratricopeptide (TPR) repeat protein
LRPNYAIAHNNLGTALLRLGRPQPALASFREAARIDPQLGDALLNVGLISRAMGDFPEAVSYFRRALALDSEWVTAISSLASVLAAAPEASVRNPEEALKLAERASTLTLRRDANTLDILAVAHAASGDFDHAVAVCDEALALNPPAALASMIRSHRDLFVKRQPYVSPR